jgi:hypothetical protein
VSASVVLPIDADLPGVGWAAIDEGFATWSGEGPGALFDCVGPEFPDDAVIEAASSPHFVRPPGALVHGLGVAFAAEVAASAAESILASADFAACLGRSVAADLDAGATGAELLDVRVAATPLGHRATFTGGDEAGVRTVHLDIVVIRIGLAVGVLWCGDTAAPFPEDEARHLLDRVRRRAA